jgi:hypothetical protein
MSSAETCKTNSICYGNWHCYCRKAIEQSELWKMAATSPSPPLHKAICTAFLWNVGILQCSVHKQTNKQNTLLYMTSTNLKSTRLFCTLQQTVATVA